MESTRRTTGISCVSNTQSCDPSGPSTAGQKTWTSGSWGACRTTGCSGSDILYRGTCYTNSKSCTLSELPANAASGTKAYTGSGRYSSTCVASTCKSSYHKDGSSCVSNTRSCTPSNGQRTANLGWKSAGAPVKSEAVMEGFGRTVPVTVWL